MIGRLKGKIIHTDESSESIIVDVNGVGYEVNIGSANFDFGSEYEIYIHTQIRENDLSLWGFKDVKQLKLFRMLTSVSGIGSRTAMLIVVQKGVQITVNSIVNEDLKELQVKGVGKKTAQKIILELKNKIENSFVVSVVENSEVNSIDSKLREEAMSALVTLGYRNQDVENALKELDLSNKDITSTQELVKELLRYV